MCLILLCVPKVIDLIRFFSWEITIQNICSSLFSSCLFIPILHANISTSIPPSTEYERKILLGFSLAYSLAQFETRNFRIGIQSGIYDTGSCEFLLSLANNIWTMLEEKRTQHFWWVKSNWNKNISWRGCLLRNSLFPQNTGYCMFSPNCMLKY